MCERATKRRKVESASPVPEASAGSAAPVLSPMRSAVDDKEMVKPTASTALSDSSVGSRSSKTSRRNLQRRNARKRSTSGVSESSGGISDGTPSVPDAATPSLNQSAVERLEQLLLQQGQMISALKTELLDVKAAASVARSAVSGDSPRERRPSAPTSVAPPSYEESVAPVDVDCEPVDYEPETKAETGHYLPGLSADADKTARSLINDLASSNGRLAGILLRSSEARHHFFRVHCFSVEPWRLLTYLWSSSPLVRHLAATVVVCDDSRVRVAAENVSERTVDGREAPAWPFMRYARGENSREFPPGVRDGVWEVDFASTFPIPRLAWRVHSLGLFVLPPLASGTSPDEWRRMSALAFTALAREGEKANGLTGGCRHKGDLPQQGLGSVVVGPGPEVYIIHGTFAVPANDKNERKFDVFTSNFFSGEVPEGVEEFREALRVWWDLHLHQINWSAKRNVSMLVRISFMEFVDQHWDWAVFRAMKNGMWTSQGGSSYSGVHLGAQIRSGNTTGSGADLRVHGPLSGLIPTRSADERQGTRSPRVCNHEGDPPLVVTVGNQKISCTPLPRLCAQENRSRRSERGPRSGGTRGERHRQDRGRLSAGRKQ